MNWSYIAFVKQIYRKSMYTMSGATGHPTAMMTPTTITTGTKWM